MCSIPIGIHFGNTKSCVAIYKDECLIIIPNESGELQIPSVVCFREEGVFVGEEAADQQHKYPETTIFGIRKIIGRKYDDPEVQEFMNQVPNIVFNDLGEPKIKINSLNYQTREYYVEEISAFLLLKLRYTAEEQLLTTVTAGVVTVPATFTTAQRDATKAAAAIAGFKEVKILEEPVAAVLAFHNACNRQTRRNIVVYDLGEENCSVSIVVTEGNKRVIKVTKSDGTLGGTAIDKNIKNYIKRDLRRKFGENVEIEANITLTRRIQYKCKKAKERLSRAFYCDIEFVDEYDDYTCQLSRAKFEQINEETFQKTIQLVDETLKESGLVVRDIDEVILVGGSTNIPRIQEMLKEYFGSSKVNMGKNPSEAMVCGVAMYASKIFGDKKEISDGDA